MFNPLDFYLTSGQWLHVSGVNGAGKTSLLRMVCGLSSMECGDILWNGQSIQVLGHAYRYKLCYLGHLNALQESLTVDENLTFLAALRGVTLKAADHNELLMRFALQGRGGQLVRHLSQGQKRRVAFIPLAWGTAPLWVLDEPYVGLDDAGIGLLAGLMAHHLQCGGLAVLASHQRVPIGDIPARQIELQ